MNSPPAPDSHLSSALLYPVPVPLFILYLAYFVRPQRSIHEQTQSLCPAGVPSLESVTMNITRKHVHNEGVGVYWQQLRFIIVT
jgi:hypothetical protein